MHPKSFVSNFWGAVQMLPGAALYLAPVSEVIAIPTHPAQQGTYHSRIHQVFESYMRQSAT